jgi:hypothetical protein
MMQLVYMGFTQQASLRCFRFQRVFVQARPSNLPKVMEITMKADMALFLRYRIPVQEGPALCLQILNTELAGHDESDLEAASYAITSEHLSSFVSARTTVEEARAARRKPRAPFKPSSSSQLKLPPRIN